MTTKCKRVHSHVYSTVLNGSIKVRAWDFASHLQTSHEPGRILGELQKKNIAVHEGVLEEDGPAVADRENCEQNLDNYDVGRV